MEEFTGKGILYDEKCRQVCEVEYEQVNNSIYLRPLQSADGPVALRSYLLPEGQTFPFQINVFPVPDKMRQQANCSMIGQPRFHDQGRNTRRTVRVPVALEGTVCNSERTGVEIQNLSAGGLMLFSEVELEVGESFELFLQLGEIRLPVKLQVRSKIPVGLEDGTTALGYGCMFEDQGPVTRIALKRYLQQRMDQLQ